MRPGERRTLLWPRKSIGHSERTRDKMAATGRKGKWTGGRPLLGYDLDPLLPRLVVNPVEAARVLGIWATSSRSKPSRPVVKELHRRGWRHKAWTTRAGVERGGEPFSTVSIQRLLTNPIYVGKVGYQGELHDGEHPAIIDTATWHKVQTLWARRTRPATAKDLHRRPSEEADGNLASFTVSSSSAPMSSRNDA